MSRVEVKIEEVDIENEDGREVEGVRATCLECDHETESFGTGERSRRRCLALLREECPSDYGNHYSDSAVQGGMGATEHEARIPLVGESIRVGDHLQTSGGLVITHHKALVPMLVVLLLALVFSAVAIRAADREIGRLRARVQELETGQGRGL